MGTGMVESSKYLEMKPIFLMNIHEKHLKACKMRIMLVILLPRSEWSME